MNILEKEIEDVVYGSANSILRERGLNIYGQKFRQVNLGSYGIADIVCIDISKYGERAWGVRVSVIELKKNLIDVNTLMQSARYEKGIRRMLAKSHDLSNAIVSYSHILIGKEIQKSGDFVFLLDAMENATAYTYSIDIISGILFNKCNGFSISNDMVGCLTKAQKAGIKEVIDIRSKEYFENEKNGNNG